MVLKQKRHRWLESSDIPAIDRIPARCFHECVRGASQSNALHITTLPVRSSPHHRPSLFHKKQPKSWMTECFGRLYHHTYRTLRSYDPVNPLNDSRSTGRSPALSGAERRSPVLKDGRGTPGARCSTQLASTVANTTCLLVENTPNII
jgi:hypothetical protein